MKKMVCEICESQSIKKENGVFVCQECGTEYSLEDAKKLLKEIPENIIVKNENATTTINEITYSERKQEKGELLNVLLMWANVIKSLSEQKFFEFNLSSSEHWEGNIGKCICIDQLGDNYDKAKLKDSYLLNDVTFANINYNPNDLGFSNYQLNIAYSVYILSKVKDKAYKLLDFINKNNSKVFSSFPKRSNNISKVSSK